MLVLSRRESEKVLFPSLGISVEVLRIQGNTTRLGIDAPPDIPVLRHEIAARKSIALTPDDGSTRRQLSELAHAVRRRLDTAATALNHLHQKLDIDRDSAIQDVVLQLYRELQSLDEEASRTLGSDTVILSKEALVVEDNAIERKLLASYLELSGFEVKTAQDGQDALDYLSMHARPDVVLVDMLMPRCDGSQFVRQVRSKPELAGLKIFAISSIQPQTVGLFTGDNGVDGWFSKPVEPRQVVSELNRQLNAA